MTPQSLDDKLDHIDAAFFSGDAFFDRDNHEEMKRLLARWDRRLTEIAEIMNGDEE